MRFVQSSWRWFLLLGCLAAAAAAMPLAAADPTFVGVAAIAIKPEVAKELNLAPDVLAKLQKLVDEREEAGLELALDLKDASAEEQNEKFAAFAAETEKQALLLLRPDQREKLEEIRAKQESASGEKPMEAAPKPPVETRPVEAKPADSAAAPTPMSGDATKPSTPGADAPSTAAPGSTSGATIPKGPAGGPITVKAGDGKLKFNFRYAPWKEVLDWFAQQADLSMELESPPPGTFNYSDTRSYTPAEAIDLLNSVLLTKGYTLVRRDRMLLLVNLKDGVPADLPPTVSLEELNSRGQYELVRCLFSVERLTPEEMEAEVRKLLGPQGNVIVLSKAKQLLITETAGKLRTIRAVIEGIENPESAQGQLHVYTLEHATPEEVLLIVRQLFGMPEGKNDAPDGSLKIAVDPVGARLLVRGKSDAVRRFEEILKIVNVESGAEGKVGGAVEAPQLEVYAVGAIDPTTAFQVLQTLLAGQVNVRLASDPLTGNIIVWGSPQVQGTVQATLAQLERDAKKTEVIILRTLDPALVLQSITKIYGQADEKNKTAPKVEADPSSRHLIVRGTQAQIDEIRGLLTKMGETDSGLAAPGAATVRAPYRIIPLPSRSQASALEQAESIFSVVRPNRIRTVTPSALMPSLNPRTTPNAKPAPMGETEEGAAPPAPAAPGDASTRRGSLPRSATPVAYADPAAGPATPPVETPPAAAPPPRETPPTAPGVPPPAAVPPQETAPGEEKSVPGADIIVTLSPNGIMIASQDLDALDEFETLLKTIADRNRATGREFTIWYLKFAKAADAAALLQEILGVAPADDSGGGSLITDLAGAALGGGGGLLDGLLGLGDSGGGAATTATLSIVPDARLNALIIQGSARDIDAVEQLLQVIDQEASPEDVQTVAKPRLIPVLHTSAEEVAGVVRQVYANRLEGGTVAQRQPSPEEFIRALRGGRGGNSRGGQRNQSEPQKLAVGVDVRSNSLIVSAPEPLFQEVKLLVAQLDRAGTESTEVVETISVRRANPMLVQQALTSLVGPKVTVSSTRSQNGASTAATSNNRGSSGRGAGGQQGAGGANPFQQQMQLFQMLQGGGRSPFGGGQFGGRGGTGSPGGQSGFGGGSFGPGGFGGGRGGR